MNGSSDARALRWYTWYGKDLRTNHESLAYIPQKVTKHDQSSFKLGRKNYSADTLWQESTLKKIKR